MLTLSMGEISFLENNSLSCEFRFRWTCINTCFFVRVDLVIHSRWVPSMLNTQETFLTFSCSLREFNYIFRKLVIDEVLVCLLLPRRIRSHWCAMKDLHMCVYISCKIFLKSTVFCLNSLCLVALNEVTLRVFWLRIFFVACNISIPKIHIPFTTKQLASVLLLSRY